MPQQSDTSLPAPAVAPAPVREVRRMLQQQVAGVMRRSMPELRDVAPVAVYDRVMDSPRLLDRAFRHFRARPDLFAAFTRDASGTPVASDDLPLHCGRTLGEVVQLVIRACAKRYFRRHFLARLYRGPLGGLKRRLHRWFGVGASGRRRAHREAMRHFNAIAAHLHYDWQARLIPVYAAMPTAAIQRLGPEILQCRDAAALARAASAPSTPRREPTVDKARTRAPRQRLVLGRSRYLSDHARDIELAASSAAISRLLGDDAANREIRVQEIRAVPEDVIQALTQEGLSAMEAVVFLFVAAHAMGRVEFAELFLGERAPERSRDLARKLLDASGRERLSTVAATLTRKAA